MDTMGQSRLPENRSSVRLHIADDPDGMTNSQGAAGPGIDKAADIVRAAMADYPWRGNLNLRPPADPAAPDASPQLLRLDWQRVRPTAAHGVWRWNGEPVAATLFLGGHDGDDARALEGFSHISEPRLSPAWLKRIRESSRPLLATAYLRTEPAYMKMLARFALGLGSAMCMQFNITRQSGLIGDALPRDFPAQFLHVVAAQGSVRQRIWPTAASFRADENIRQVLGAFNDRLEERHFEERLAVGTEKGRITARVRWQCLHPTAGLADLIDGKSVRHELLLLGRHDAPGDDACRRFARRFPSRGWEKVFNELRSAPRPILATVTRTAPPQRYGHGALLVAGALAATFFRRIGAF